MKILFDNSNKIERIVDASLECKNCDCWEPFSSIKWPACNACPHRSEKIYYEGDVGSTLLVFTGIDWDSALSKVKEVCASHIDNRLSGQVSFFEWMELNFMDLKTKLGSHWDVFRISYDWYGFYLFCTHDEDILCNSDSNQLEFLIQDKRRELQEVDWILQYAHECVSDESFYDSEKYRFAMEYFIKPVFISWWADVNKIDYYNPPNFNTRWSDEEERAFMDNFIPNLSEQFEACKKEEDPLYYGFDEKYESKSLWPFLAISLEKTLKAEYKFKKCANCGLPFIPYKRQDRLYCDRSSPQDITKTCQEYGARQAHQDSLKSNEAMKLYRNIYMAKQMMAKRNPDYAKCQIEFDSFKESAKKWKSDIKKGVKTETEYLEWLKENKHAR